MVLGQFASSCVVNMAAPSDDLIFTLVFSILTLTTGFIIRLLRLAAKYTYPKPSSFFGVIEIIILLALLLSAISTLILLAMSLVT